MSEHLLAPAGKRSRALGRDRYTAGSTPLGRAVATSGPPIGNNTIAGARRGNWAQ